MKESVSDVVVLEAGKVLDHLILGIADLDRGIEWVQGMTGVRATPGGSHPGAGTRNALLSLGNRQYLEIMSIDPVQKQSGRWADLVGNLAAPQLIMWAAATGDIAAVSRKAQAAGYGIEGPIAGSRAKPNSGMLHWRMLNVLSEFGGVIPFFIEWGAGIVHPAEDSPEGCSLKSFVMEHPEPDRVRKILKALGVKAEVERGNRTRLKAVLITPKGLVHIS